VHLVNVKAPGKRCVRGVEQKQGLSGWWTEDVHAEPKVEIVAKFRFGADGGCDMEILALQRDRQVCWRCVTHLSGDEWIGTELSFELRAKDGGTDPRLCHRRWSEATDFLRYCSVRWALYLVSLTDFVETGTGNSWPRDIQS